MLAYLERLRFLRNAAGEGLISNEELQQQRKRLLRAATTMGTEAEAQRHKEIGGHDAKRAWWALLAALIDVIESYVEESAAVAPRASAMPNGAGATEKPVAPAYAPKAAAPRQCPQKPIPTPGTIARHFTFNRRGDHCFTKEPLPRLDPLSFDLGDLWRGPEFRDSEAEAANAELMQPAPTRTPKGARAVHPLPAHLMPHQKSMPPRAHANKYGQGGVRAMPTHGRVIPRRAVACGRTQQSHNKAQKPALPRTHRTPAMVRDAAEYVAKAAGLQQTQGIHNAKCEDMKRMSGVRFTLHAELMP